MNRNDLPPDRDPPRDIGDENIERLLGLAYLPEEADAEFVRRLQARLCEVARARAAAARPWRHLGRVVLAASLAAALFGPLLYLPFLPSEPPTNVPRTAEQPAPAAETVPAIRERPDAPEVALGPQSEPHAELAVAGWLVPCERPPAPPVTALTVGETLETGSTERRLAELADGSRVYLNSNTKVQLTAERQLKLTAGEVFLDVAQPPAEQAAAFLVTTPEREVQALGSRLAVRTEAGTGVVVAQGKAKVSGIDAPICAGQQLRADNNELVPAPRTSHLLAWTRDLMVTAEAPLVPPSAFQGGALLARTLQGQETRLGLRKYHVDVFIEDGFARTTIDQTYFNHQPQRLEGTFCFPLPPDASLSRLAMYVDGQLMEGGMVERDYGRAVYESTVRRMQEPALLEWVDGTTFKMRVFPLEGRQEKRIILSYTQKLPSLYGRLDYRFPAGPSLEVVRDWSFHARVKNGAAFPWTCDSHLLKATKEGADLLLDAQAKQVKIDRDIRLSLYPAPREDQARFACCAQDGANYLMLRYRPALPAVERKPSPRNWVFLFESSADRDPLLARVQVDVVRGLLSNVEPGDTFAVLTAGTRVHAFAEEPQPATPDRVKAAAAFLERAHLIGALDLGAALTAAEPFLKAKPNSYLVHLGSGTPAIGEQRESVLVRRIPEGVRYVGVGVGRHWARGFMKAAAERTGGYFTQINPDEPVAWRAFDLFCTLNTPRLLGVQVADAAARVRFLCAETVLSQGEELCAIARAGPGVPLPETVVVSGTLDGQPFRKELPVRSVKADARYLPRTWARLEIDRLLAEDALKNREQIVQLSKAMYVMTPFTSLLVLESEELYRQFKVDRGRQDHWALYDCPKTIRVVHEPLNGERPRPASSARPSAEEVLQSILVRVPPRLLRWTDQADASAAGIITARDLYHGAPPDQTAVRRTRPEGASPDPRLEEPSRKQPDIRSELRTAKELSEYALLRQQRYGKGDDLYLLEQFLKQAEAQPSYSLAVRPGYSPYSNLFHDGSPYYQNYFYGLVRPTQAPGQPTAGLPPAPVSRPTTPVTSTGGVSRGTEATPSLIITSSGGLGGFASAPSGSANFNGNFAGFNGFGGSFNGFSGFGGFNGGFGGMPNPGSNGTFQPGGVAPPRGGSFGGGPGILGGSTRPPQPSTQTGAMVTSAEDMRRLLSTFERLPEGERRKALEQLQRESPTTFPSFLESHLPRLPQPERTANPAVTKTDPKPAPTEPPPPQTGGTATPPLPPPSAGDTAPRTGPLDAAPVRPTPITLETPLPSVPSSPPGDRGRDKGAPADPEEIFHFWLGFFRDDQEKIADDEKGQKPSAAGGSGLLYRRPSFSGDPRVFHDLVSYAPGLNTLPADVQAVVDAEAAAEPTVTGKIAPAARALIDRARAAGWQALTLPGPDGFRLVCDGGGRYAWDRVLPTGLREQVICDGEALLHLYPEIGLGARRSVSRFHRAEFAELVPWVLPPAEELARGADLMLVDRQTVAIEPHAPLTPPLSLSPAGERERGEGVADGKPPPYVRVQLLFSGGRLVERQLVEMPTARVLARETYATDGTVALLDAAGKERAVRKLSTQPAAAPDLKPNLRDLVVLPLPWRTRDQVAAAKGIPTDGNYAALPEDAALALLAAAFAQHSNELPQIVAQRYLNRGDGRLGLHVLLAAADLDTNAPALPPGRATQPLARYLASLRRNHASAMPAATEIGGNGFLARLAVLRDLAQLDSAGKGPHDANRAQRRALETLRNGKASALDWALLSLAQDRLAEDAQAQQLIRDGLRKFADMPGLDYAAAYESARLALANGRRQEAQETYEKLYTRALEAGTVPAIDLSFRAAFRGGKDSEVDGWAEWLRQTAARLVQQDQRRTVFLLVRQAHELGDSALAGWLLDMALDGVAASPERVAVTLAAVAYLTQTRQFARADELLQPLLDDPELARNAALWRLGARLAGQRRQSARAFACLEQALEIEHAQPAQRRDPEAVCRDYGALLGHYEQLAGAFATLQQQPPTDFVPRVVRAADRWRALKGDGSAACQCAARIFKAIGAVDLAWDYLTTPLSQRRDEPAPWLNLARTLREEGQLELAERAYALAFEAEPTNAPLLWEQARVLRESGKADKAQELLLRLADGEWPAQFRELKVQALREAERHRARPAAGK